VKAVRQKADLKRIRRDFPDNIRHAELFESIQDAVYSVAFNPPVLINPAGLRDGLRSGRSVLDQCTPPDAGAFAVALGQLLRIARRINPDGFPENTRETVTEDLLHDYLALDKEALDRRARTFDISIDTLISCCQQAARPQLSALWQLIDDSDLEHWSQGYCPACGALPTMAQVQQDGVRRLLCAACLGHYRFDRYSCPGCGHAGLRVLEMDAWPGLLVETCPECNAYLKTWDTRTGQPPCEWPLIDIVTRAVDEAAGPQGLVRLSPGVMGI
jgi:hypothetical protein